MNEEKYEYQLGGVLAGGGLRIVFANEIAWAHYERQAKAIVGDRVRERHGLRSGHIEWTEAENLTLKRRERQVREALAKPAKKAARTLASAIAKTKKAFQLPLCDIFRKGVAARR